LPTEKRDVAGFLIRRKKRDDHRLSNADLLELAGRIGAVSEHAANARDTAAVMQQNQILTGRMVAPTLCMRYPYSIAAS
jgi:hypothetical protein